MEDGGDSYFFSPCREFYRVRLSTSSPEAVFSDVPSKILPLKSSPGS